MRWNTKKLFCSNFICWLRTDHGRLEAKYNTIRFFIKIHPLNANGMSVLQKVIAVMNNLCTMKFQRIFKCLPLQFEKKNQFIRGLASDYSGYIAVLVLGFRPCRVKRWLTIFGLVRWCLWKNTQLPILLVEKGLRQEGHPAVKFLLQTWKF